VTQQNVQLETVLQMTGFSFQYPMREKVLNDTGFDLRLGEKVALVGENGAGKTTLFHLITGLINHQSGQLMCMGNMIESEADFVFLRQKVGLVFQDPDDQLFCPSVLEDVMFGPLNQGFSMDEAKQKSELILEQLNLIHLSESMASQLSGGEKRMVTLASVLVMEPKVLLLDEPTNALDVKAKARLLKVLQALPQAILVISHDHEFLTAFTDRQLSLVNGKLHNHL
jgi:cobalt/nickel transport system ATP-binding protein